VQTRITELLGIQYPIIQAPMSPISVPRLAAAVSNAGGLGILNAGHFTPGEIRQDIRYVRELTDKPFGVNLTAGTPGYERLAEAMIDERVAVIVHGRGNPQWLIETARGHGIIIMAQIGAVKHALRAERDGADILCVAGLEAGGHVSPVSTMVLTPLIASRVKIPVVAAGGFCDGMGLVAALALGAEGIALGTRFAVTQESGLPENIKQRYLDASETDTLVTPRITGAGLRVLHNKFTDMLERDGKKLSWREKISGTLETRRMLGVSWWRFIIGGWKMRKDYEASFSELGDLAASAVRIDRAMKQGDAEYGVMIAGQVCGRIDDIPSAGEIVERIVAQARNIMGPLSEKVLS
jgi:NAD(P)H-dependent flavin oxidoreductase YrpB (nitropropane dioxygenase family)